VTLLSFQHAETGCSLVIDDDGRVAYAYLRGPDDEIIGDVWLYNRTPCLEAPDWTDVTQAPFLNPASMARPLEGPPTTTAELSVEWTLDGILLLADIHLRGELLARVSPGSAPGWNVLALEAGPCAVPFPPEA
jgi:hypothetical protein